MSLPTVHYVAERILETFMDFDGSLFQTGIKFPPRKSELHGRIMPNGSIVRDTGGRLAPTKKIKPTRSAHDKKCASKNCICRAKLKTTKDAMGLLRRVDDHFEYSGVRGFCFFDKPLDARRALNIAFRATRRKWVPPQKTKSKKLAKHDGLAPRAKRSAYATRMVHCSKPTKPVADTMRAAVTNLYGQGFLAKNIRVYPYRENDIFHAPHRVNVYKRDGRFDVIDASCNLPILAGISSAALRKVVKW